MIDYIDNKEYMICPVCQLEMILCDYNMDEDIMTSMTYFECPSGSREDSNHYSIYYGDSAWWVEDYNNYIEVGCEVLNSSDPVFSNYIVIRSPTVRESKLIRTIDPFFFNKANNVLQRVINMKAFL